MQIINLEVENFVRDLVPERQGILAEMEQKAKKENIPIVMPEVGQLLYFLAKLHKPKRVLEVGTAIGYSTLCLASGMPADLKETPKLITIERNEKRYQEAQNNINSAGLTSMIQAIHGDALEVIPAIKEQFDFIFIDAAKGQYANFFDLCFPLLKTNGLIVADNVLIHGLVTSQHVVRRNRTMVKRIKKYLNTVTNHPKLDTTVLPIGDGVALSYKKE